MDHMTPDLSSLSRQLTDLSPLPMAAVEGDGHVVRYANPAFCRLVGKDCDKIVGRRFGEVVPAGEEFDRMQEQMYHPSADNSGLDQPASDLLPAYWSHITWPVLGPDERPVGIIVQITDTRVFHDQARAMNESLLIATVKQHELTDAEEALNTQLQAEITDRKRAEQGLKDADRLKDEFLAMLAHELRNPLAPIRNAVEILRLSGPEAAVVEQQREVIDRQVTHLARLVDDLLDVSRVTAGKIELQKQPVYLSAIVASAIEAIQPFLQTLNHTLIVTSSPNDPCVEGDFDRLTQVLTNLLNNAAKYTDRGGQIWLETATEDNEAVLRVRDTGIGIAPEMLSKVFELFGQADVSFSRSRGGLGLGLTLVRRIVELHGGTVDVFSGGAGKGSEFVVRLPALVNEARDTIAQDQAMDNVPFDPPLSRRRVLVVDDAVESANSLAQIVELWGNEAQIAVDGPSALEAVRSFRPEFVLLDIGLPGMDGFEVAKHIRDEYGEHIIIVAQTGYGREDDHNRTHRAGFDYHMVKPLDLKVLKALLSPRPTGPDRISTT